MRRPVVCKPLNSQQCGRENEDTAKSYEVRKTLIEDIPDYIVEPDVVRTPLCPEDLDRPIGLAAEQSGGI